MFAATAGMATMTALGGGTLPGSTGTNTVLPSMRVGTTYMSAGLNMAPGPATGPGAGAAAAGAAGAGAGAAGAAAGPARFSAGALDFGAPASLLAAPPSCSCSLASLGGLPRRLACTSCAGPGFSPFSPLTTLLLGPSSLPFLSSLSAALSSLAGRPLLLARVSAAGGSRAGSALALPLPLGLLGSALVSPRYWGMSSSSISSSSLGEVTSPSSHVWFGLMTSHSLFSINLARRTRLASIFSGLLS
mmetsp:Transcript_25093/g.54570  ORF Transcript_25093/g.54570 Transcript_25093/m.54570 type:complete len:246 (-) Transcript_25093:627-1364(-)